MLPMTLRCSTCCSFLSRGTKFNMSKDDVAGERYLGVVQVLRFRFRCSGCSVEIAFKTDPRNSDYAVEWEATRVSAEPWREEAATAAAASKEVAGSDRDWERPDAVTMLEELRWLNSRRSEVSTESAIEALKRRGMENEGRIPESLGMDDDDEQVLPPLPSSTFATKAPARRSPPPPPHLFPPRHDGGPAVVPGDKASSGVVVEKKQRCLPGSSLFGDRVKVVSAAASSRPLPSKTSRPRESRTALQVLRENYADKIYDS